MKFRILKPIFIIAFCGITLNHLEAKTPADHYLQCINNSSERYRYCEINQLEGCQSQVEVQREFCWNEYQRLTNINNLTNNQYSNNFNNFNMQDRFRPVEIPSRTSYVLPGMK